MDLDLYGPWLIVGGYAVAVLLLFIGSRTRGLAAKLAFSGAGLAGSTTTLFWLTLGTFTGPMMYVWALAPIAVAALLWVRRYQQSEWMDRLAGKNGRIFDSDRPGRPSFGVLSGYGRAVAHDDPDGAFDTAVEVELAAHRVIGMQYRAGAVASSRSAAEAKRLDQAIDAVDSTHGLVQLQVPTVPALLITPRPLTERAASAPGQVSRLNPFEDYRISRNTVGALVPDAELAVVERGWEPEFAANFAVRAENEAFAHAALSPEVQRLIVSDPWFRVRQVACHRGSLWTSDAGQLTEWALLTHARQLARLAAAVPEQAWSQFAPASQSFVVNHSADPAAWRQRRSFTAVVNERRIAANRVPLSPSNLITRVFVLAVLLWFAVVLAWPHSESGGFGIPAVIVLGGSALWLAKVTFAPRLRPKATPQAANA